MLERWEERTAGGGGMVRERWLREAKRAVREVLGGVEGGEVVVEP